mmetsp:Transcript_20355/g.38063  ORF Transcript_20355/g.38063 Transcript_20355/m.38063 type:complete len:193 (-) Transcript_20355:185-763(-)
MLSLLLPLSSAALCSDCSQVMLSNLACDYPCNIIPCNLDTSKQVSQPYLPYFETGECIYTCLQTCPYALLEDGTCNEECNSPECAYDLGDCGYCAPGCFLAMLSNKVCDDACKVEACDFDITDCGCSSSCPSNLWNNSVCDQDCNSEGCDYDNWKCACSVNCSPGMLGNGSCDTSCKTLACSYDQGDCVALI